MANEMDIMNAEKMMERITKAADYIREHLPQADTCVVLGSGLGNYAKQLKNPQSLSYADIPGFPVSTVQGHAGLLWSGSVNNKKVYLLQGRFHYYEGYELCDVVLYVRVMKLLGVKNLIVTNAAGGINPSSHAGDLMLIKDHINMVGANPLTGRHLAELGPRFNDMTHAYSLSLQEVAKKTAEEKGISLESGVYAWMKGPSYETPAEIRMLRVLGADLVGMSTVPEVIVAANCGMEVLGISLITNMAAGVLDQPLNHQEVMETAAKAEVRFTELISGILEKL